MENVFIDMEKHRFWGDSINFLNWEKRQISGHLTPRPNIGDYVICKMKSGIIGKFKIVELELCKKPSDMFFGVVEDLDPQTDLSMIKPYRK